MVRLRFGRTAIPEFVAVRGRGRRIDSVNLDSGGKNRDPTGRFAPAVVHHRQNSHCVAFAVR